MSATMPIPDHDFHAEGDEDLLAWMAMRQDEPDHAKAACTEFYGRHLNYVYTVIREVWGEVLDEDSVEYLVTETFVRVFDKAHTYAACGAPNDEERTLNVLGWVSTIAKNLVADYFRHEDTRIDLVDDWEPLETKIAPREYGSMSADARRAGEALDALPERERTILLASLEHFNAEADHQRLPNGVVPDLARTFQTKPENIRQIRKRALAKIRKHVEDGRVSASPRSEA